MERMSCGSSKNNESTGFREPGGFVSVKVKERRRELFVGWLKDTTPSLKEG
jgi:hypothetical protein